MKKGKNRTMLVLALEIAAIIILHVVKLNQSDKLATNKDNTLNQVSAQTSPRVSPTYSLAVLK